MNKKPTIASGVALAAGGMLAATLVTPTLSATADGDGGGDALAGHERSSSARAFAPYRCNGGQTRRVWNHGMRSAFVTIPSGGVQRIAPNIRFRGPRKGRDTLSVTVSGATHNHADSGLSRVEVSVNGRPLKPAEFGTAASFGAGSDTNEAPSAHALQFCGKVNKGRKRVRVRFQAFGGDVHVEDVLVHAELNR